ncbi:hypothetical protein [Acidovorax sp. NCPPB 3576]|uniref:hypothetical protein n=1 Tax=Acidovorax sp. NCPPB 3576 TaxID=2940488 RepID=UPI00234927A9|nr:hypothetical protein [Acidovorax sp. NCPPB 3576]WCM86805.1 hypothetical protein M5C98_15650 [Acidovorax sp. NCPPB 3576]
MKPRDLHTIHNLIVTNYTIVQQPSGSYLHKFTPATTATVYQFEGASTPRVVDGKHYNIGFRPDRNGLNIVDTAFISEISEVDPAISHAVAQKVSAENYAIEKVNNDRRVTPKGKVTGYYWGKKYAWRVFGLAISQNAFDEYLKEIGHPTVPCTTYEPDKPFGNTQSIAYAEEGLEGAMKNLITLATKKGSYYTSPLYSKKFAIKGINAITDKKA